MHPHPRRQDSPYIGRICQRETSSHDGKPITGGLVTVRDSNWMLSWNVERNPHFRDTRRAS